MRDISARALRRGAELRRNLLVRIKRRPVLFLFIVALAACAAATGFVARQVSNFLSFHRVVDETGVTAMAWSPDGQNLAVGYHYGRGMEILSWESSGKLNDSGIRLYPVHNLRDLVWSPDGVWIAGKGENKGGKHDIHLLRPSTRTELQAFSTPQDWWFHFAWASGHRLVCMETDTLKFCDDPEKGEAGRQMLGRPQYPPADSGYSQPSGSELYYGSRQLRLLPDNGVRFTALVGQGPLWIIDRYPENRPGMSVFQISPPAHMDTLRYHALSPDGKWLAVSIFPAPGDTTNGIYVQIWDVTGRKQVTTLAVPNSLYPGEELLIRSMHEVPVPAWSLDGKRLAMAFQIDRLSGDCDVGFVWWDIESSRLLAFRREVMPRLLPAASSLMTMSSKVAVESYAWTSDLSKVALAREVDITLFSNYRFVRCAISQILAPPETLVHSRP